MLVEFTRALQQNPDDAEGQVVEHKIAIEPALVSAVFESTTSPNVTIVRLMDGRGFQVRGTYDETMENLPGSSLIEFVRALQQDTDTMGEDDGIGAQVEHKIAINPSPVAAVFESTQAANVAVIRLADGRGFQIRGSYTEIMDRLRSSGSLPTQTVEGEQESLH